jgi:hypothetical protein
VVKVGAQPLRNRFDVGDIEQRQVGEADSLLAGEGGELELSGGRSGLQGLKAIRGDGSARREQIEQGLLTLFIQRSSWIFYRHIEDKYPDKS